jgi:hypothetical protein
MSLAPKHKFLLGFLLVSVMALVIGFSIYASKKNVSKLNSILEKVRDLSSKNKVLFVSQDGNMVAQFDMTQAGLMWITKTDSTMYPILNTWKKTRSDCLLFLETPTFDSTNKDLQHVCVSVGVLPFEGMVRNLIRNDNTFPKNELCASIYANPELKKDNHVVGYFYFHIKQKPLYAIDSLLTRIVTPDVLVEGLSYGIVYN